MINIEKVLNIIQKYPENEFTKDAIIPLLKKMQYKGVEFYGGTDEHGKDIIFWEEDKWGNMILRVAQVKHLISSKKYNDKNSIQSIVNQLVGCFNFKLKYNKNIEEIPTEAFLFTTYRIDTKILMSRFSSEPSLIDRKIRIIDGEELVKKLFQFTPEFIKKIVGPTMEIDLKVNHNFSNIVVHKVLGDKSFKDIKSIYSDIDFSLGKINTNFFFNSSFNVRSNELIIFLDKWLEFKELCKTLKNEYPKSFLINTFELIEEKNEKVFNTHKYLSEEIFKLNNEFSTVRKVQRNLLVEIEMLNQEIEKNEKELDEVKGVLSNLNKESDVQESLKIKGKIKKTLQKVEESKNTF